MIGRQQRSETSTIVRSNLRIRQKILKTSREKSTSGYMGLRTLRVEPSMRASCRAVDLTGWKSEVSLEKFHGKVEAES
jgi:hypothetical protein